MVRRFVTADLERMCKEVVTTAKCTTPVSA